MIVSWMTTNQCNLKCVHCYQDAEEATERELSTDEAKKMIDEIARAGFKIMIFSGGEPLLRPDIYELVAHAASRGLRPVFGSNGTLITPEAAARLKEAGACAMGISVDSLDAAKHDKFRGLPNAHALTLTGIEACKEVMPNTPMVAVFDTAFHQTMPPKAYIYAVPYRWYTENKVRRYGFHGTSHRYVSHRVAELMGKDIKDLKLITCHIGNGSSITAIEDGKVIDTSMGLTPLDGFMMGTRTGTLDPSVVTFIAEKENLTPAQLSDLFNKKSGLLGISGISSDDRDICKAEDEGDERAHLAHEMLVYQIQKFIGSYVAALNGVDAIVFTAGLGENQDTLRERICTNMEYLGIKFDHEANKGVRGKEKKISAPDSKVAVYIVPTNEELVIARDTKAIVEKL